jgi:hypothetical protein
MGPASDSQVPVPATPRDTSAFDVREALVLSGCPVCRLAVRSVGRCASADWEPDNCAVDDAVAHVIPLVSRSCYFAQRIRAAEPQPNFISLVLRTSGLLWRIDSTMTKENSNTSASATNPASMPQVVDRVTFHAQLDVLRVREKAHTHEGDAIAAARRRLPMVEVDANTPLVGPTGRLTLLEAFEGRRQLITYSFMWSTGRPAAEQCEGCTWVTSADGRTVLPSLPRHHVRGLL